MFSSTMFSTDSLYKMFGNLDGIEELIDIIARMQENCHKNITSTEKTYDTIHMYVDSYIESHNSCFLWDSESIQKFRTWIGGQVTNKLRENYKSMEVSALDNSTFWNDFEEKSTNYQSLIPKKSGHDMFANVCRNDFEGSAMRNEYSGGSSTIFVTPKKQYGTSTFNFNMKEKPSIFVRQAKPGRPEYTFKSDNVMPPRTFPQWNNINLVKHTLFEDSGSNIFRKSGFQIPNNVPMYVGNTFQHETPSVITTNSEPDNSEHRNKFGTDHYKFEVVQYRLSHNVPNIVYAGTNFNSQFECSYNPSCELISTGRIQYQYPKIREKATALFYCTCQQAYYDQNRFQELLILQFSLSPEDVLVNTNDPVCIFRVKVKENKVHDANSHFRPKNKSSVASLTQPIENATTTQPFSVKQSNTAYTSNPTAVNESVPLPYTSIINPKHNTIRLKDPPAVVNESGLAHTSNNGGLTVAVNLNENDNLHNNDLQRSNVEGIINRMNVNTPTQFNNGYMNQNNISLCEEHDVSNNNFVRQFPNNTTNEDNVHSTHPAENIIPTTDLILDEDTANQISDFLFHTNYESNAITERQLAQRGRRTVKSRRKRRKKSRTPKVESDSEDDIYLVEGGKTDPNERPSRRARTIEGLSATAIVRRRERSQYQIFEKTYMSSVVCFKQQHYGYYDIPCKLSNIDESESDNETKMKREHLLKHNADVDSCYVCFEPFINGENVAVHSGCNVLHALHLPCFEKWCCTSHETPTEDTGPDTLNIFKGCYCNNGKGKWIQWTYNSNTTNWKNEINNGLLLPDNKEILGIHEHKKGNYHFLNFIVCAKVLYSIKHSIINTKFTMDRPTDLEESGMKPLFIKYMDANKRKFKCEYCEFRVPLIRKCRLDNCKKNCRFSFCRECFIKMMTSDETITKKNPNKGIMNCIYCDQEGQAVFVSVDNKNEHLQTCAGSP